jgi:membrane protein
VLFSLVPFVALFALLLGLLLPETTADRVTSWLVDAMPLEGELEDSVAREIEDVGPPSSLTGLISLLLLVYGASGMMGATRSAFRAIWGSEGRRPYLRGKLVDVALVLLAGLLVLCAFGVTVIAQIVERAAEEVVRKLGGQAAVAEQLSAGAELVASAAVTFVALLVLYRFVPTVRVRLRDAFVGALVAWAGFNLAAVGFSLYIDRVADFDDVFGPLSAVFVFLVAVYATVAVLLFGASLAAAWPGTALAGERQRAQGITPFG